MLGNSVQKLDLFSGWSRKQTSCCFLGTKRYHIDLMFFSLFLTFDHMFPVCWLNKREISTETLLCLLTSKKLNILWFTAILEFAMNQSKLVNPFYGNVVMVTISSSKAIYKKVPLKLKLLSSLLSHWKTIIATGCDFTKNSSDNVPLKNTLNS